MLQETLKEELVILQKQQIIVPLGVEETLEWCNNFCLVPKTNGKVQIFLDQAIINKTLFIPIHRGPTINDFLPRLAGIKYHTLIDASSGYHNLK